MLNLIYNNITVIYKIKMKTYTSKNKNEKIEDYTVIINCATNAFLLM